MLPKQCHRPARFDQRVLRLTQKTPAGTCAAPGQPKLLVGSWLPPATAISLALSRATGVARQLPRPPRRSLLRTSWKDALSSTPHSKWCSISWSKALVAAFLKLLFLVFGMVFKVWCRGRAHDVAVHLQGAGLHDKPAPIVVDGIQKLAPVIHELRALSATDVVLVVQHIVEHRALLLVQDLVLDKLPTLHGPMRHKFGTHPRPSPRRCQR